MALELLTLRSSDLQREPDRIDVLDERERERAGRLRRTPDRRAYLQAHVLLREGLARRMDCRPEEVVYGRGRCPCCGGPDGRPVVRWPDPDEHFSISRSDGAVVVALAREPVGVDVQAIPEPRIAEEVAPMLSTCERAKLESVPDERRAATFARLWARKEAYLKALGTGIVHGLGDEAPESGWTISDLSLGEPYAAALALRASRAD